MREPVAVQGLITAEWRQSENNRRARFYRLTAAGRARLAEDLDRWTRLVEALTLVLSRRTVFRSRSRRGKRRPGTVSIHSETGLGGIFMVASWCCFHLARGFRALARGKA